MARMTDKSVLITGGARGIGQAVALRVAEEGGVPIIVDRRDDDGQETLSALRKLSPKAQFHVLDVTDRDGWAALAKQIEKDFGGLDGLVNNAGISAVSPVGDMLPKLWDRVIAVNLSSLFTGTQIMAPLLQARGGQTEAGASIVNVSSIMGFVSVPGASAYSAAKGGVRLFTKSAALDFAAAGQKIRVNSIHPGFIVTPMHHEGMQALSDSGSTLTPADVEASLLQRTPIGRLGTALDIAHGVLFLLSDESAFMTGSELVMDGGYTAQ